jgi:hypothetical protein
MEMKKGYEFDRYAAAVAKKAIESLETEHFGDPVVGLWLFCAQSQYHVTFVLIETTEGTREIEIDNITTMIPAYMGDEKEKLLDSFVEERGLDKDDLDWGGYGRLPWSLLCHQLVLAADTVSHAFRKFKGVQFDPEFRCGICLDDEKYQIAEIDRWTRSIQNNLGKAGKNERDFLSLCLSDPVSFKI